jgi:hypothetical protein
MKSKGNLTKEIFCGDEGRDERSQNKRDHESNGKMRVNLSTIFSVNSRFMKVHQMMMNHITRNTQVEWAFFGRVCERLGI